MQIFSIGSRPDSINRMAAGQQCGPEVRSAYVQSFSLPMIVQTIWMSRASGRSATARAHQLGAVDGDVPGGGTPPDRDVPFTRSRLSRRLEGDPDVTGN